MLAKMMFQFAVVYISKAFPLVMKTVSIGNRKYEINASRTILMLVIKQTRNDRVSSQILSLWCALRKPALPKGAECEINQVCGTLFSRRLYHCDDTESFDVG